MRASCPRPSRWPTGSRSSGRTRPPSGFRPGSSSSSVRARRDIGFLKQNEKKEVRWKVKVKPGTSGEAEVSILSTRGGVARTTVKIG